MNSKFVLLVVTIIAFYACGSKSGDRIPVKNEKLFAPEEYIGLSDSTLIENSGLLLWNNHFWTFNDSGGKNEIYGLNENTGQIVITIQLANAKNVDWEDIAQDKKYIYIAETGNNAGARHDLKIYRILKKMISTEPHQIITVDSILFQFADQYDFTPLFCKTKYDCEALMVFDDSLFVFTKDWINSVTKVYGFPSETGNFSIMPIDSFNVDGLVTGADILPNGKFSLVGYKNFHSFIWLFDKKKACFFCNPRFIDLKMLENAQTEGICFSKYGDIFFSCEQTVNFQQQIWKIPKKNL